MSSTGQKGFTKDCRRPRQKDCCELKASLGYNVPLPAISVVLRFEHRGFLPVRQVLITGLHVQHCFCSCPHACQHAGEYQTLLPFKRQSITNGRILFRKAHTFYSQQNHQGAGEAVQWLQTVAALAKDTSLVPSTHTHRPPPRGSSQPSVNPVSKSPAPSSGLYGHCMNIHTWRGECP